MIVAVVGLGKLGLPFAVWLASNGHQVTGIDTNSEVIQTLDRGECPVQENGLKVLLASNKDKMRFTTEPMYGMRGAEIIFIVVPTPSEPSGMFSIEYVNQAATSIGIAMRESTAYRVIVLVSTVMPGQTEQVKAVLEAVSGRQCGPDFGLCYNPEFIALGSVLRDLDNPDVVLVGQSDARAGAQLASFYAGIYEQRINALLRITSFINAEVAKLEINAFLTTKITFACAMARLAEKLPGADVDTISYIVGADSRIGRKYLTGANGFGGPCFPRDTQALAALEYQHGVSPRLIRTVADENEGQIWAINSEVIDILKRRHSQKVLVLGMAYKPGTDVQDESQGLRFIKGFKSAQTLWYDPMAKGGISLESLPAAIREAAVVVLMQPCPEFRDLDYGDTPVLDCWRLLRDKPPKNWHPMGIGEAK